MVTDKIYSYLGFASKSRSLVTGYNTCILMMEKRKIKLLILCSDLAENTLKKMTKECNKYDLKFRIFGKCDEISKATGNVGKGIFGITDKNFAEVITKEIDQIQSKEKEGF